jgi:beta-N-acetylhexosaminidase
VLSAEVGEGPFWNLDTPSQAAQLLDEMSPEEIVSQLFMVSWPRTEPSEKLLEWVRERNIGGIKIFGWNANNLKTMVNTISTMQRAALDHRTGIPLLVATDQEGGWVRHVKGNTSSTPGNMAIGASGLPYDAYRSAKLIGEELRTLGINMNFAPTVDVYVNAEAAVIGPRAFSGDPVQVGTLGAAFYEGLKSARVIATAKHFPGHGDASGDSHGMLPYIEGGMETLWNRDLVPYRIMIPEGLPAIMSGHLAFPDITGPQLPSSLSEFFGRTVLRERLGFQGLMITDDLYMEGAAIYGRTNNMSFPGVVLQAIRSGNDMIMLSHTPELNGDIWQRVFETYQEDPAFRAQVRASARRILEVKLQYLKPDDRVPLFPEPQAVTEELPNPEAKGFFSDQAARSVTVVRGERHPLDPAEAGRVLIVGRDPLFLEHGRQAYGEAETLQLRNSTFYSDAAADRERFQRVAARYDTIIYNLASPSTLNILRSAPSLHEQTIVISSLTPIYLSELPEIRTAVAVYGWNSASYRAGFAALQGHIPATGTLPIELSEE